MSGPGGSSVKSKFNYCNSVVTQAIYVLRKWLIVSTSSSSKKREREEVNWVEIFSSDDEFQRNSTSRSART